MVYDFFRKDSEKESDYEFFNIDIHNDTDVFIDPVRVEANNDEFSISANECVVDFFNSYLKAVKKVVSESINKSLTESEKKKNRELAKSIYADKFKEISAISMGYSRNHIKGKGLSEITGRVLNDMISDANLLKAIKSLDDIKLFVDGVSCDRLMDIYANIIRELLNEYTISQCRRYGLEDKLKKYTWNQYYWDINTHNWVFKKDWICFLPENDKDSEPVLLVPKSFLGTYYSKGNLYYGSILDFFVEKDKIKHRNDPDYKITKKAIRDQKEKEGFDTSKRNLAHFISENIEIRDNFRKKAKEFYSKK